MRPQISLSPVSEVFHEIITDPVGIHARPAGILVKEVKNYTDSVVTLTRGDKTVNLLKLMALMQLGVKQGDTVTVSVEGGDEAAVCAALETFFKENL